MKETLIQYNSIREQPKCDDPQNYALYRIVMKGGFSPYGVNSWEELKETALGENYQRKIIRYTRSEQLEQAVNDYLEFTKLNGRQPVRKNQLLIDIYNAIRRGIWDLQRISTWEKFLDRAEGRENRVRNKYVGKEGFRLAIKKFRRIMNDTGNFPKNNSKLYRTVHKWANRGKWTEIGIKTYSQFTEMLQSDVIKLSVE